MLNLLLFCLLKIFGKNRRKRAKFPFEDWAGAFAMRACLAVASKAEADTWKNSNKTLLCSQADWQNSATPFSRLNNSGIFIHFLSSFLLQRLRGFCRLNILSNVIRQTMRYEPICLSTRKSCRKSLIGTSIVSKMDTKLISPMEPWTTLQTTSKPNLTSMQYRYSVLCLGLILLVGSCTNKRARSFL